MFTFKFTYFSMKQLISIQYFTRLVSTRVIPKAKILSVMITVFMRALPLGILWIFPPKEIKTG